MKRILAPLLLLTALLIPVSSAGAATPQAKQIKAMQKQMKTMQKQVKTLQKQVKTLQTQVSIVNAEAGINFAATTCGLAMTADQFQATWKTIDAVGSIGAVFDSSLVGTPLADYGACADISQVRKTGLSTPTWLAYNSLISWLYAPS